MKLIKLLKVKLMRLKRLFSSLTDEQRTIILIMVIVEIRLIIFQLFNI